MGEHNERNPTKCNGLWFIGYYGWSVAKLKVYWRWQHFWKTKDLKKSLRMWMPPLLLVTGVTKGQHSWTTYLVTSGLVPVLMAVVCGHISVVLETLTLRVSVWNMPTGALKAERICPLSYGYVQSPTTCPAPPRWFSSALPWFCPWRP